MGENKTLMSNPDRGSSWVRRKIVGPAGVTNGAGASRFTLVLSIRERSKPLADKPKASVQRELTRSAQA
jgi:hypothetical protein